MQCDAHHIQTVSHRLEAALCLVDVHTPCKARNHSVQEGALAQVNFARAMDASWIIALWRAIHLGDPGPDEIVVTKEETAATAAMIIETLRPFAQGASETAALPVQNAEEIQRRLGDLGIDFHTHEGDKQVELRVASFDHLPPRICPCFGPAHHRKCYCVSITLN